MRKYFLLIFFIILICFNCGYTIKGGVSYTVETARQISFAGVSKNIDIKKYKNYLHDEYFCKNMEAKTHHKNKLKNRSVTFFQTVLMELYIKVIEIKDIIMMVMVI